MPKRNGLDPMRGLKFRSIILQMGFPSVSEWARSHGHVSATARRVFAGDRRADTPVAKRILDDFRADAEGAGLAVANLLDAPG